MVSKSTQITGLEELDNITFGQLTQFIDQLVKLGDSYDIKELNIRNVAFDVERKRILSIAVDFIVISKGTAIIPLPTSSQILNGNHDLINVSIWEKNQSINPYIYEGSSESSDD